MAKADEEEQDSDDEGELPMRISIPSDFENFRQIDPLAKIDELCDHLVEQIRGQSESARMDSKICQLQADLNYLER